RPRLSRRCFGGGNNGAINSHCSSVNNFCRFFMTEAHLNAASQKSTYREAEPIFETRSSYSLRPHVARVQASRDRSVGSGTPPDIFLRPLIPCVQASRDGGVGGAFDDGTAVGEEGHLIRLVPELQHELVMSHLAVRGEAAGDFVEVYGALTLVNL